MSGIRDAISEALLPKDDEDTTSTEGTAQAEATDGEVTTPGSEGTDSTADTDVTEGTADEAEAPDSYFGVDLSGLSAEERAEVIAGYQERDKFIQQLLRDKSASTEGAETAETPNLDSDEGEMTDSDILAALGVDPDDPYSEATAKVALPLAKLVIDLNAKVEGLSNRAELDSTERYWETSLTALETQYGTLPLSHEDVMREAAKGGIAEPMDAYWRIMGPGREAVMKEVTKRRAALAETLKKGTASQKRPSTSVDSSEQVIDAKDMKDAVRQAFSSIAKERGLTFTED